MSQDHNHLNHATWECKYQKGTHGHMLISIPPKYSVAEVIGYPRRPEQATAILVRPGRQMTLGNMHANGVPVARCVMLAVPCRCRRLGRGVHPLRHRRCPRPAELAGATGTAERHWHCAMAMSRDQRRALRLLAGSPLGVTEAIMLAHSDFLGLPI
jgi:hypothetical protein